MYMCVCASCIEMDECKERGGCERGGGRIGKERREEETQQETHRMRA